MPQQGPDCRLDPAWLDGFGAPGFESWALEVWLCLELLPWPFTGQPVQECKRRSELHFRVQTLFSKLSAQGSYSRFTTAFLSSKPGSKELIKVRLCEI